MTFNDLEELHYITPLANIGSIYKVGILSHKQAEKVSHESVAMDEIQERRKKVVIPNGRPLHQYVNLYFHARNPMMFKRKGFHKELCVVKVNKEVSNLPQVVITDGNASSEYVRFYPSPEGLRVIDKERIFSRYWNNENPIEKFRHAFEKCAEVLIPDKVPREFIIGVYVSCNESKSKLYDIIRPMNPDFPITVTPDMFFQ
jgi:hypothetical protein